ncbi:MULTISPECIES: hypothetical protein [unclassified Sphingobium]|uniref:hypothetical protein n=1 Tax=unclassified Sphingobium TaxID=2611147 RepID=UPI00222471AF|nr:MULTISPECIES: hypothetical protein [unclassified Sphingobium]MCW2410849.1 hypothetical protein [Sphingobium sp. B8D3D]MCW2416861.1 hypothetical protein [Sphingobium sp. B8D3A]
MSFDLFFRCMSDESADPLTVPKAAIVEELARELHMRRHHYPDRIASGKMTREGANREISIMAAIHADLAADLLLTPGTEDAAAKARREADERLASFGWGELVSCLRREIAMRRKFYPRMLATGDRSPADLRAQLERLEAAHFYYWALGRAWWPDGLEQHRQDPTSMTDRDHQTFREAYAKHRAHFVPITLAPRGAYSTVAEPNGKAA